MNVTRADCKTEIWNAKAGEQASMDSYLQFLPVIPTCATAWERQSDFKSWLLELNVLRLGLLQDGDVGVGVFPKREEIAIHSPCFGNVTCHRVSAT